jgi:hypothetical protein
MASCRRKNGPLLVGNPDIVRIDQVFLNAGYGPGAKTIVAGNTAIYYQIVLMGK